ncbi:hypothetical protein [Larsenimonas suaedae]|uniref:Uncharacterized protein n=1 Tax=Larsenimonas suaedae TaxID=1851019 RepID=A0ABU1H0Z3_9GAMM|nr:hypothetical protein [Larsenimonas suaedae]MCM2973803.1 hypothetical protein [Larsenimonas suaedae]MDR5897327.1 hypothetical protein [Larsenimonas suaedae]
MTTRIRVVGMDPSLRNWGLAAGYLDLDSLTLEVTCLDVINPVVPTGKQVRQNSKDLESAYQMYEQALGAVLQAQAVFVEVPVGSQSARAMSSYGICVGVLGAIRKSLGFYQVTPTEVKLATAGTKTASKKQMIEWATTKHPEAHWPTYTKSGQVLLSEAKAEHQADAIGAIYAGAQGVEFQRSIPMFRNMVSNAD